MKKVLIALLVAAVPVAAAIGFWIGQERGRSEAAVVDAKIGEAFREKEIEDHIESLEKRRKEDLEKRLDLAVESITKRTPQAVGEGLWMDSAVRGPGGRLILHLKMADIASAEAKQSGVQAVLDNGTRTQVCGAPLLRDLLKQGAVVVARYRGSDDGFIGNAIVIPGDC